MAIAGKTYRIKSRKRFSCFVIVLMLMAGVLLSVPEGPPHASGLTEPVYIEIQVKPGDTLWQLAHTHMPEYGDIRRAVHLLGRINGISAEELRAGQVLLIPVHTNSDTQHW